MFAASRAGNRCRLQPYPGRKLDLLDCLQGSSQNVVGSRRSISCVTQHWQGRLVTDLAECQQCVLPYLRMRVTGQFAQGWDCHPYFRVSGKLAQGRCGGAAHCRPRMFAQPNQFANCASIPGLAQLDCTSPSIFRRGLKLSSFIFAPCKLNSLCSFCLRIKNRIILLYGSPCKILIKSYPPILSK